MALVYVFFNVLMACIVLCSSGVVACTLPAAVLDHPEQLPARVQQRFCHPDTGYDSLLLIRAAIQEDAPVFRIIAVKRDEADHVQEVKLYQYDKDGNDHGLVGREPQAVIDFTGTAQNFEGRVKGRKTSISFEKQYFGFDMRGLFGLKINRQLNTEGKIAIDGMPTSLLLINTSNKDNWRWVLDNGAQARF